MIRLGLRDLPELPTGSVLQVEEAFDGLELRWLNPGDNRGARRATAFIWPAAWALGCVTLVLQASEGVRLRGVSHWTVAVSLGVMLAAGGLVVLFVVRALAERQREFLLLERSRLVHREGTPPFRTSTSRAFLGLEDYWQYWWSVLLVFKDLRSTAAERDEVREVRLEGGVEWQRVTVCAGSDRIRIGEYLSQPECEWLADVLRLWLARG